MRARLFAAALSLLSVASMAQAQFYAPKPLQPVPIASVPVAPAALPAKIDNLVQASHSTAGCNTCGPVVAHGDGCAAPSSAKAHRGLFSRVMIGAGTINPVSCGCTASERTFVFGSCKQFFNSQCDCPGCWPVDRRPPGLGVTSYLNR